MKGKATEAGVGRLGIIGCMTTVLMPGLSIPVIAEGALLEEVVVTARQRVESLQDVPASISVLTESDIYSANITRPEDFIALTPGMSQVQSVEVGDMQVVVRGINSGRDTESSVALVIDGIQITNPNALNQELDNLTQIEVLKGPQGALYGRNALAGAILMTTKKPGDEFESYVKGGFGRYGLWSAGGGVSGPLTEQLSGLISAYHREEDGSFKNSFKGCDDCENQFRESGVVSRLIYQPSENTEIDVKARYSEVRAGGVTFNASLALVDAAAALDQPMFYEDPNDHDFTYINKVDPDNRQENMNLSFKMTHYMDGVDLQLAGAYNDVNNRFISPGVSNAFGIYNANDTCQQEYQQALSEPERYAVPAPFFYAPDIANSFLPPYPPIACGGWQYQQRDQNDWYLEARLTSNGNGPWHWMAGTYYANIDRHLVVAYGGDVGTGTQLDKFSPTGGPIPTDLLYDDDLLSEVYAVFANGSYDINDRWELAVALRYDIEDRSVNNNVPKVGPQTPGFGAFGVPVCPDGPDSCTGYINPYYNVNPAVDSIPDRDKTFRQFQPKVTLNWDMAEDVSTYASYGVGFRSGGFNSSGTATTLSQYFGNLALPDGTPNLNQLSDEYDKEVSKAAELGFKSRLMDGTLELNGAVYHTEVKDGQDFSFFAGPCGSLRVVTNVDKARLQGVELDFKWRPIDWLKLYGGFNYIDTEIRKYKTRPYTEGNKVPYIPEYDGNLGAEFIFPVFDHSTDFIARIDQVFMGETWFSPVQDQAVDNFFTAAGFGRGDFSRQHRKPYTTTNLTLSLSHERWSVTAWAHNVFDEEFLAEIIPAPEFGGSFIHDSYGRTYGMDLKFNF